jgi:hypothetical protein
MQADFFPSGLPRCVKIRNSEKKASIPMRTKAPPVAKRVSSSQTPVTKPTGDLVFAAPSRNGQPVLVEEIRKIAYQKWERAGKPDGDGVNFWLDAERELSRAK